MSYDYGYPQNHDAEARGWGKGWEPGAPIGSRPASYPGKVVPLTVKGVSFPGGIREELAELAGLLLAESLALKWIPSLDDPGCWGGAFRPTKRSDGTYTTTPSNHSWYTAIDINAPHNVYGSLAHQIPQNMADLWKHYGWRWLGPPIRDWMHFDYAGSPQDAAYDLAQARKDGIGMALTADQARIIKEADAFLTALRANLGQTGDPTKPATAIGAGARTGDSVKKSEKGGATVAHSHSGTVTVA